MLVAIGLVVLVVIAWSLKDLLLLVFGATVVAALLHALAAPIERHARLSPRMALLLVVLLVLCLFAFIGWRFGADLASQARTLREQLPQAWDGLERRLGEGMLGERVAGWLEDPSLSGAGVLGSVSRVLLSVGGGLADLLLVVVGGVYLAAQPGLYGRGLLLMVPPARRPVASEALDDSVFALRLWLRGQIVSMAVVAVLIGAGLWWIGIPSALALALLAGLLNFVPVLGPFLAAVPALLLASTHGFEAVTWTLGLFVAVQQIEGNLVQPIVQQRVIDMPPALLLFSIVAAGLLFGAAGVMLAAPLTVVVFVLVKRLYIVEALDTPTRIPGERDAAG